MSAALVIFGLAVLIIVVMAVAVFRSAVQDLESADEYKCPVDNGRE